MTYLKWSYPIDRITMRRQINQHIIDSLCKEDIFKICFYEYIYCWNSKDIEYRYTKFICDKCLHTFDMTKYPERSFIDFYQQTYSFQEEY